jgi:Uncharacterized conserved protein (DUF2190)
MTDYIPKFKPGQAITLTASGTVTGGRLQAVTGVRTIADAGADSAAVVGVAGVDGVSGDGITVFTRAGGVHRLTAVAAIAAGALVVSAAGGKVQTKGANVNVIGLALTSSAADLDLIEVLFI